MKRKNLHKNRLQNGTKNGCSDDDFLEPEIWDLDQNLEEDLEMFSDNNFLELEIEGFNLKLDFDLEFDLNIEIDFGFSDILDFKLMEMSDLDWKDLFKNLNFDIELPDFDFIE